MYIEQIFTGCLAEYAYYIESEGEAAVIDPLRDTAPYLAIAQSRNATIKYVFETHFHADFVSGHLDLAKQTGAIIVYGPGAKAGFDIHTAQDEELFTLGKLTIKLLHTPGHTEESSCFLLLDENFTPHSIFTGDTLFAGDVGRPDLAVRSDLTKEMLAAKLYESIHQKLLSLPNYVIVYPGHGAGSACGKVIGSAAHTTIGEQKAANYALKAASEDEFVKLVTEGLSEPPKYFFSDARINKSGYQPLDELMANALKPLDADAVALLANRNNCTLLDVRDPNEFCEGFIPGAVNVGLNGSFAVTAGTVIDLETQLVVIATPGKEEEAIMRLMRVGFENIAGYLDGGINNWASKGFSLDKIDVVTATVFEHQYRMNNSFALDVRSFNECVPGIVAGAMMIPLPKIESKLSIIPRDRLGFVYCAGGYRSVVALSLLRRAGFKNLVNVQGGMSAIRKTQLPIRQLTAEFS